MNSKNLVHRDLKPCNILLKDPVNLLKPDSVKLLDFGLSTIFGKPNLIHFKCGTPGYIAPEILNSKTSLVWTLLNSKIDIFSAGVILHEFLFGAVLYEGGGSQKEILLKNKIGSVELRVLDDMITDFKCQLAYDLLRKMIQPEQSLRISLQEALNHGFFKKCCFNKLEAEKKIPGDKAEGDFLFDCSYKKNLMFENGSG